MAERALPSYLHVYAGGVHAVDTGFQREGFDAAYLMVQDGRAAFIDTGTNIGVPRLLGALEVLGIDRADVDFVIPTHAHLDHAGASGLLMTQLPNARLVAHPRAAKHLIDPSALVEGALAVYGQAEMDRSYGRIVPVPAGRVLTTSEGSSVELAGRPLRFIDTPGHARHHHCVWDEATRGWFTGDTFGLSYREFDTARGPWILPTSTPVQFDPEPLVASIERLLAADPAWIYLTHFGRIGNVQHMGRELIEKVRGMAALGRALQHAPDRHEALKRGQLAMFMASLQAHDCTHGEAEVAQLLAMDLELNAQGLAIWLDKSPA